MTWRLPGLGTLLAWLTVVGLLLAFAGVVVHSRRQAESSHRAQALQLEAIWRCNALKGRPRREDCLRQFLRDQPPDSAALKDMVKSSAEPAASAPASRPHVSQ